MHWKRLQNIQEEIRSDISCKIKKQNKNENEKGSSKD